MTRKGCKQGPKRILRAVLCTAASAASIRITFTVGWRWMVDAWWLMVDGLDGIVRKWLNLNQLAVPGLSLIPAQDMQMPGRKDITYLAAAIDTAKAYDVTLEFSIKLLTFSGCRNWFRDWIIDLLSFLSQKTKDHIRSSYFAQKRYQWAKILLEISFLFLAKNDERAQRSGGKWKRRQVLDNDMQANPVDQAGTPNPLSICNKPANGTGPHHSFSDVTRDFACQHEMFGSRKKHKPKSLQKRNERERARRFRGNERLRVGGGHRHPWVSGEDRLPRSTIYNILLVPRPEPESEPEPVPKPNPSPKANSNASPGAAQVRVQARTWVWAQPGLTLTDWLLCVAAQLAQIIHPFPVKPIFLCHLVYWGGGGGSGGAVRQVPRQGMWEWNRQPRLGYRCWWLHWQNITDYDNKQHLMQ